jgi:ppGpp synthetase/RelA/SpoT-type nucleotidyltranferase
MDSDKTPFRLQKGLAETWSASVPTQDLGVIDEFLKRDYHYGHYKQLAQRAHDLIKKALEDPNNSDGKKVQAKITWRAKDGKSLREKLIMRNENKRYKTADDIWKDVPDLAGVRMVLYTPNDEQRKRVKEIIQSIWSDVQLVQHGRPAMTDRAVQVEKGDLPKPTFNNNGESTIPLQKTESARAGNKTKKPRRKYMPKHLGYEADHYRVVMQEKQSGLTDGEGEYTYRETDKVEVQVMSALTHAWAEAGHEVLYKQHAFGTPTRDEQRILDSLRGLVSSGDLLLEQFHESVNKRTYARIFHRDEFGTFLRNLDVLQVEEEDEEDGGNEQRTDNHTSRYQTDFKSEGVDILFDFLVKQNKNYPLAVRDALKSLGYPDDPTGKASEILESFDPYLEVPEGLLASFCLIHQMLPPERLATTPLLSEQCRLMIIALTLLQNFAGDVQVAEEFLDNSLDMTPQEKLGLDFVLSDNLRRVCLTGDGTIRSSHRVKLQAAWEWFQKEASNEKSVCGFLFRLAEMGVAQEDDENKLVTRLYLRLPVP